MDTIRIITIPEWVPIENIVIRKRLEKKLRIILKSN